MQGSHLRLTQWAVWGSFHQRVPSLGCLFLVPVPPLFAAVHMFLIHMLSEHLKEMAGQQLQAGMGLPEKE